VPYKGRMAEPPVCPSSTIPCLALAPPAKRSTAAGWCAAAAPFHRMEWPPEQSTPLQTPGYRVAQAPLFPVGRRLPERCCHLGPLPANPDPRRRATAVVFRPR
jgi:hypothetical protein